MKRILIFGAIFSGLLVLIVPSISAIEYHALNETSKKTITKALEQKSDITVVKILLLILSGALGWIIGTILYKIIIHPLLQMILGY